MSGELESNASTSQSSDQSLVQKLLTWLDACRADKAPADPEAQRGAVQAIEQRLAEIVPFAEADLFTLAARLSDKALAPATRDSIAANVAKAAALMASRWQRLVSWQTTYNGTVAELRRDHSNAIDRLANGIELLEGAQADLANAIWSPNIKFSTTSSNLASSSSCNDASTASQTGAKAKRSAATH